MAKVKLQAGKEDVKSAIAGQEDLVQAPPGVYTAELVQVNTGHTKGEDGKPDKDRPYLECIYSITGVGREGAEPEERYARLWDYVSFGTKWKVAQFGIAMEVPVNGNGGIDGQVEIEADKPGTIIGKSVIIRVKRDKDLDGNYRGKINSVLPMSAGTASESSAAFADDADGSSNGDDPFSEDQGSAEDLLTRSQLEEMDLKELGALCTEFDLTPQDYIVKVRGKVDNDKTKAAVVDAILEAQGGDPEAEETGDPDDPF